MRQKWKKCNLIVYTKGLFSNLSKFCIFVSNHEIELEENYFRRLILPFTILALPGLWFQRTKKIIPKIGSFNTLLFSIYLFTIIETCRQNSYREIGSSPLIRFGFQIPTVIKRKFSY